MARKLLTDEALAKRPDPTEKKLSAKPTPGEELAQNWRSDPGRPTQADRDAAELRAQEERYRRERYEQEMRDSRIYGSSGYAYDLDEMRESRIVGRERDESSAREREQRQRYEDEYQRQRQREFIGVSGEYRYSGAIARGPTSMRYLDDLDPGLPIGVYAKDAIVTVKVSMAPLPPPTSDPQGPWILLRWDVLLGSVKLVGPISSRGRVCVDDNDRVAHYATKQEAQFDMRAPYDIATPLKCTEFVRLSPRIECRLLPSGSAFRPAMLANGTIVVAANP